MRGKYRIWLTSIMCCLFVILPFMGYGAGLVIGNTVTVNGDLVVTAQSPFWGHANGTIDVGLGDVSLPLPAIPDGQRLVIEHVALRCLADSDDSFPEVFIVVYQKGGTETTGYSVPILAVKQGVTYDGKASWVVSQPVRLYSDGGSSTNVSLEVHHSKTTATASCFTLVSGYTVITP
jgi:hypothetical protein